MAGLVQDVGHNEDIIGVIPYLRIHDYVCKKADIVELVFTCEDFLPKLYLKLRLPHNTLNETNKLNDGDLLQLGIRSDLKVFKSISVDILVTKVIASQQARNENNSVINEYEIFGKLNVPYLESENIKFSYQGTAEEALMEIAKRVGLGYVENTSNPKSPDKNTRTLSTKKETWQCYSKPIEFIKNTTQHMWAGTDSFFDSWIDPYLNLVNVNIGDMLGRHVEDDGVLDETKWRSIVATAGADGKYAHNDLGTLEDYKDNKMLTNDKTLQSSVWFINKYHLENNSTLISKKESVQQDYAVYIQNNGLGQSENDSEHKVSLGVWYNPEKISLGYVTMNGPSPEDRYFKKANNGNYKEQNLHYTLPEILPVQSDGDEELRQGGDNTQTSGNFSKEYVLATDHNRLNLRELEKQLLLVYTTGFNNGIAKGEKVPVMIYRQTNEKVYSDKRETMDNTHIFDPVCSGWFIVKGIQYTYKPDANTSAKSDWTTKITLTRREWFPPEATTTAAGAGDEQNSLNAESALTGTTTLNDVATNSKTADGETGTSSNETGSSDTPSTQTEMSGMADEVQGNQDGLDKNADAINAIDAAEKSEDALDDEDKLTAEEMGMDAASDEDKIAKDICPVCGKTLTSTDSDGKTIKECQSCGWDSDMDVDAYKRKLSEDAAIDAAQQADEEKKKEDVSLTITINNNGVLWNATIKNDSDGSTVKKYSTDSSNFDTDGIKAYLANIAKEKYPNATINYDVQSTNASQTILDTNEITFNIKISNQNNKYWKVETSDSTGKSYSEYSKLYSKSSYDVEDLEDKLSSTIKKVYTKATFNYSVTETIDTQITFVVSIGFCSSSSGDGFYTTTTKDMSGKSYSEYGLMVFPDGNKYTSEYVKTSVSNKIKKTYSNATITFNVDATATAEDAKLAKL